MKKKKNYKSLNTLLHPWIKLKKDVMYNNIVIDSRKVKLKDLFIALMGYKVDGKNFIKHAILKGAIAVLAESVNGKKYVIKLKNNSKYINVIYLPHLSKNLSLIASKFYQHPSKNLKIVAITGTNGKTTITNLISQWVYLLGEKTGLISTIGNGIYSKKLKITKNTTDSAIDIQKNLKYLSDKKVKLVSLEVTSHALHQNRVASLNFDAAVFVNLTHDHLDYHKNMLNYELSKWKLFSKYKIKKYIINADDKIGHKWLLKIPQAIAVSIKNNFFLLQNNRLFFKVNKITFLKSKTIIEFQSSWGCGKFCIYLLGEFNVVNVILSLVTLLSMKYSLKSLLNTSNLLTPITGRIEFISKYNFPRIVIDYAHTPDALKNILKSLRLYCKKNIWCIFGCGGNRDITKRSIMGYIAVKYSDIVIITEDNSRTEDSKDIIKDITSKIKLNKVKIILDRKKAISYAILNAQLNDIVLISGKGHEKYQIIGNNYIKYSDKDTVNQILRTQKN